MQLHAHFLYSHTQLMAMAWPEGRCTKLAEWACFGQQGGRRACEEGFVCVNSHGREPDWLKTILQRGVGCWSCWLDGGGV